MPGFAPLQPCSPTGHTGLEEYHTAGTGKELAVGSGGTPPGWDTRGTMITGRAMSSHYRARALWSVQCTDEGSDHPRNSSSRKHGGAKEGQHRGQHRGGGLQGGDVGRNPFPEAVRPGGGRGRGWALGPRVEAPRPQGGGGAAGSSPTPPSYAGPDPKPSAQSSVLRSSAQNRDRGPYPHPPPHRPRRAAPRMRTTQAAGRAPSPQSHFRRSPRPFRFRPG